MSTCSNCEFGTITQDGDVYCALYDQMVEWSDCCEDHRTAQDDPYDDAELYG